MRLSLIVLVMTVAAGCATTRQRWVNHTLPRTELTTKFAADNSECTARGYQASPNNYWVNYKITQDCLIGKGWEVEEVPNK